jgi:hypothetical protein
VRWVKKASKVRSKKGFLLGSTDVIITPYIGTLLVGTPPTLPAHLALLDGVGTGEERGVMGDTDSFAIFNPPSPLLDTCLHSTYL